VTCCMVGFVKATCVMTSSRRSASCRLRFTY